MHKETFDLSLCRLYLMHAGREVSMHANGGSSSNGMDLGGWEAQLAAREKGLEKREATVAAAESRAGVRPAQDYLIEA